MIKYFKVSGTQVNAKPNIYEDERVRVLVSGMKN